MFWLGCTTYVQVAQVGVKLPWQVFSGALEWCGNRIMAGKAMAQVIINLNLAQVETENKAAALEGGQSPTSNGNLQGTTF